LARLLLAMQQMQGETEERKMRAELIKAQVANMQSQMAEREAQQAGTQLIGQLVPQMLGIPSATAAEKVAGGRPQVITPEGQRVEARRAPTPRLPATQAVAQVAQQAPSQLQEATRLFAGIEQMGDKELQEEALSQGLNSLPDDLRKIAVMDMRLTRGGMEAETRGPIVRESLARLSKQDITKLKADPRFKPLASLPDDEFVQRAGQWAIKLMELAQGIGVPGGPPKTFEEFSQQQLPALTRPHFDTLTGQTMPGMTLDEARKLTADMWQAITKFQTSDLRDAEARFGSKRPLAGAEESAAQLVASELLGQEGVERQFVEHQTRMALMRQGIRADEAMMRRIYFRAAFLHRTQPTTGRKRLQGR
jgi:hypothetical protein